MQHQPRTSRPRDGTPSRGARDSSRSHVAAAGVVIVAASPAKPDETRYRFPVATVQGPAAGPTGGMALTYQETVTYSARQDHRLVTADPLIHLKRRQRADSVAERTLSRDPETGSPPRTRRCPGRLTSLSISITPVGPGCPPPASLANNGIRGNRPARNITASWPRGTRKLQQMKRIPSYMNSPSLLRGNSVLTSH